MTAQYLILTLMVMVFACVGMVDTYDQAIDNLQLSLQGYNNIQPKFIKP